MFFLQTAVAILMVVALFKLLDAMVNAIDADLPLWSWVRWLLAFVVLVTVLLEISK